MTFLKRWLPTFLAFPLGGFLAVLILGSLDDPAKAAAGGLIAGAVIGAGQWLALRSRGIGPRWIGLTAAAMAAGSAASVAVTSAGTERADVLLAGLVTGAAVGAAQSVLLPRAAALWAAVSAVAWSLAWLTTSFVIVDIERGYAVFGSSGALVATILTGLALTRLLAVAR
jgi:hypothetical protein